jgi:hypothetical protein
MPLMGSAPGQHLAIDAVDLEGVRVHRLDCGA